MYEYAGPSSAHHVGCRAALLSPLSNQEIILKQLKLATLIAVAFASAPALAHISYTARDFGSFSGLAHLCHVAQQLSIESLG